MTMPPDLSGSCWCCGQHGLSVPSDGTDGLCATCRGRSPSACQRVHALNVEARAAMEAELRDRRCARCRRGWHCRGEAIPCVCGCCQ